MLRLFRYMKEAGAAVIVIIGLLIVQAYCDLALPQYMSDIVDIGVQQGGIADVAPEEMRLETLENLCLFLEEADAALVRSAYFENAAGNYERAGSEQEELEQLNRILGPAMLAVSAIEESGQATVHDIRAMIGSGMLTKQQLLQGKAQAMEQFGELSESIIAQRAILFVRAEYEAIGKDLGALQNRYLLTAGGKMLALSIVMMLAAILIGLLASRAAAKIGLSLRERVFKKVVSFSNAELDHFSTASLITRSTNDIQQVQMVTVMLLRVVFFAPIIGIGGVIKVMGTKTGMGWIIGVAVGIICVLVTTLMAIAMPKFKRMQTLVDRLNQVAREILTGIPVIRAFSREEYEEQRFDGANRNLMQTQLFTNRTMTFMMPTMMFVMNGITVLIVWVGAQGVDLGNLQVGDLMAFITYTMQIVMSFLMITMISVMLPRAGVAANRIEEVLKSEPSIRDRATVLDDTVTDWRGEVCFEDVSFRYPNADEDVLQHINFTARPGQTTAIIGSTGSGKSTLMNLVPRFFDVTEGRITLDGVDIRDLSRHTLRSMLGYVPQRGVLFSGDIESNLKFGGDSITDEVMEEAARIAQAYEFIETKPERFQSPIAQGGTNVSGGQKQRLSIARAIAKGPKVYLFDDSFSALDYKTDVTLRRALADKTKEATVLIVAQRISTILHADQIVVLDEGKVVGIGNHQQLMESCEAYQEIAKSQLSETELKGGMGA